MLADLISGPLKDRPFCFHVTDSGTGERTVQRVGSDAADKLKRAIEEAVAKS